LEQKHLGDVDSSLAPDPAVYIASALLLEGLADEATFLIARALNKSRADSRAARIRWWRVYSAFPRLYREAAARCWERRDFIREYNA
jgi:hypothetical protein